MTKEQFIKKIQSTITVSGMLPEIVPNDEIDRIIDDAQSWFYDNYETAVSSEYYVLELSQFQTREFKDNRTIYLPKCVISVAGVREMGGLNRLGSIDRDFSENKLLASEIFLSSTQGDDLVMRTAQYQFFDLAKAYFLDQISYDFNRNTKELYIKGRTPKHNVVIETWSKIPLDKLFEDVYFRRYCVAQAKISFSRLVQMYPFPLPGEVEINGDKMQSEGEAEIEKILTDIDEQNVCDWFLMFH